MEKSYYLEYIEEGLFEYRENPADDPIRKLWVWKPNTLLTALSSELHVVQGHSRR